MKPWKSAEPDAIAPPEAALQWGHGDEAVEEKQCPPLSLTGRRASMGPRR